MNLYILSAVALVVSVVVARKWQRTWKARQGGIRTKARVTGYETRQDSDGDDVFHPVLVYQDQKGETCQVVFPHGSSWLVYPVDSEVDIWYDPETPVAVRIEQVDLVRDVLTAVLILFIFYIISLAFRS